MMLLGAPFFGLVLFSDGSASSLSLIVWFGSIHSMMSKSMKNALFDPTTQMAYIPLDEVCSVKAAITFLEMYLTLFVFCRITYLLFCAPFTQESKVRGKAAIDVMGSRLGKSGCALLQQVLVLAFGTINVAAPAVAILFYSVSRFFLIFLSTSTFYSRQHVWCFVADIRPYL